MEENINNIQSEQREVEKKSEKEKIINILNQLLGGVKFHIYYTDFFQAIGLEGLSHFHKKQKTDEENKLNYCKSKYIDIYKEIPVINNDTVNNYLIPLEHDKHNSTLAVSAIKEYKKWELSTFNNFTNWEEFDLAKGVFQELEEIQEICQILKMHGENKETIEYISNNI